MLWVGVNHVVDVFRHACGHGSGGTGWRDDEVGKARECFVFAWREELRRVWTARGLRLYLGPVLMLAVEIVGSEREGARGSNGADDLEGVAAALHVYISPLRNRSAM